MIKKLKVQCQAKTATDEQCKNQTLAGKQHCQIPTHAEQLRQHPSDAGESLETVKPQPPGREDKQQRLFILKVATIVVTIASVITAWWGASLSSDGNKLELTKIESQDQSKEIRNQQDAKALEIQSEILIFGKANRTSYDRPQECSAETLESAYRLARRGLMLDPKNSDLHCVLGHVQAQRGQDFRVDFEKALVLDPRSISALSGYGAWLRSTDIPVEFRDPKRGKKMWERGALVAPNDPAILCNLAQVSYAEAGEMVDRGEPDRGRTLLSLAEQRFKRAAKQSPNARAQYAIFLIKQQRQSEAHSQLLIAIKEDPRCFKAQNQLGIMSYNKGTPEGYKVAAKYLEKARELDRRSWKPCYFGSISNYLTGQLEEAIKLMRMAKSRNPMDYSLPLTLGTWYLDAAQTNPEKRATLLAKALLELKRAQELALKHPDVISAIGRSFTLESPPDLARALKYYIEAAKTAPASYVHALNLGIAYDNCDKIQEAIGEYRRALTLNTGCQFSRDRIRLLSSRLSPRSSPPKTGD